jgi:hypothetical protein
MSGKKKKRLLAHYTIAAIERNVTIRLWFRVIEELDIVRRLRSAVEAVTKNFKGTALNTEPGAKRLHARE